MYRTKQIDGKRVCSFPKLKLKIEITNLIVSDIGWCKYLQSLPLPSSAHDKQQTTLTCKL